MPNKQPLVTPQTSVTNNLPPKITKETLTALEKSAKNQYLTTVKIIIYVFLSSLLVSFSA